MSGATALSLRHCLGGQSFPKSARPLKPGQSLGHYHLERLIGQGGMGPSSSPTTPPRHNRRAATP